LDYYDEQTKERYIPHCIEPSLGVDRLLLALICSVYDEDEIGGEKRTLLRFNPKMAPIKVTILPLVKNKIELVNVANQLYEQCKKRWNCSIDMTGAIGRRYRRADEVGTPFCITIDFDTIENIGDNEQTVTIRDRDTTNQIRIPMKDVIPYLSQAIDGY
jgi:glycyl-tRNA synthetase